MSAGLLMLSPAADTTDNTVCTVTVRAPLPNLPPTNPRMIQSQFCVFPRVGLPHGAPVNFYSSDSASGEIVTLTLGFPPALAHHAVRHNPSP